jgi:hypothetical protein
VLFDRFAGAVITFYVREIRRNHLDNSLVAIRNGIRRNKSALGLQSMQISFQQFFQRKPGKGQELGFVVCFNVTPACWMAEHKAHGSSHLVTNF